MRATILLFNAYYVDKVHWAFILSFLGQAADVAKSKLVCKAFSEIIPHVCTKIIVSCYESVPCNENDTFYDKKSETILKETNESYITSFLQCVTHLTVGWSARFSSWIYYENFCNALLVKVCENGNRKLLRYLSLNAPLAPIGARPLIYLEKFSNCSAIYLQSKFNCPVWLPRSISLLLSFGEHVQDCIGLMNWHFSSGYTLQLGYHTISRKHVAELDEVLPHVRIKSVFYFQVHKLVLPSLIFLQNKYPATMFTQMPCFVPFLQ